MARRARAAQLDNLLPEWREKWTGVPFSVTQVARTASLAADNVLRIVEGREGGLNPGIQTVKRIEAALDYLRDRCPSCYRKGFVHALKEKENEFIGGIEEH